MDTFFFFRCLSIVHAIPMRMTQSLVLYLQACWSVIHISSWMKQFNRFALWTDCSKLLFLTNPDTFLVWRKHPCATFVETSASLLSAAMMLPYSSSWSRIPVSFCCYTGDGTRSLDCTGSHWNQTRAWPTLFLRCVFYYQQKAIYEATQKPHNFQAYG